MNNMENDTNVSLVDYFKINNKTFKTILSVYELIQSTKSLTGIYVGEFKFIHDGELVEGCEHEHTDHLITLNGVNIIRVFCINGFVDLCEFKNIAVNALSLISFDDAISFYPTFDCFYLKKQPSPTAEIKTINPSSCELITIECECGYHMGIDYSYVEQVSDFKTLCPSCDRIIDTATIK